MSAGVRDKRYNGRVASRNRACTLNRVGGLTIADPLPRLTGHLVAGPERFTEIDVACTLGVSGLRGVGNDWKAR